MEILVVAPPLTLKDCDRAFLLRVSYIEIYNETLRDLLNNKQGNLPENEKPTIHTNKGKVYVEPLVEAIVSTPQDVVNLLERGNINRKTGATDWVCLAGGVSWRERS